MTSANSTNSTDAAGTSVSAPQITIVSGDPTDEEIAVLTAVLTAAASASAPASDEPNYRDNWGRPTASHRTASPFSPYAYGGLTHR